ncbi:hypothetical protein PR048_024067 [Dryococelus australis]|uniref:Mutator-like transposase domain-containing protein n=1 Tax=Dryococelus australis TaxID=614101 RepID=A0ABQ9GVX9_9NEOP|nr:hypothetical protein PR048_024067 [Dryococelus australis]
MKSATEETVTQNINDRDLTVALDGSWHRRRHVSLYGVVTCASVNTGKVIDVDIISKHCTCKDELKGKHEEVCSANHKGTSGNMEVSDVVNFFNRSIPQYNVQYRNYLGDDDCKGHKAVLPTIPCGDKTVSKLERFGHIQKRMCTKLKKLKTKWQGKKIEDGKPFGSRRRVTDSTVADIQKYYGLAIRRNSNNLQGMRESVWEEYFHLLSSDEDPQHGLCPKGAESWCKY